MVGLAANVCATAFPWLLLGAHYAGDLTILVIAAARFADAFISNNLHGLANMCHAQAFYDEIGQDDGKKKE